MGRELRRPEGETLLKEAERGWRERGLPPSEGFSSWRKDRRGGQRHLGGPGAPQPHPQRMMASSHLLGAGVSDNLGVPSVSLLSEDAVASESVRWEGRSVGVISVYLRGIYNFNSTEVIQGI